MSLPEGMDGTGLGYTFEKSNAQQEIGSNALIYYLSLPTALLEDALALADDSVQNKQYKQIAEQALQYRATFYSTYAEAILQRTSPDISHAVSHAQIAGELDIPPQGVHYVIRTFLEQGPAVKPIFKDKKDRIGVYGPDFVYLYQKGFSQVQIAQRLRVSSPYCHGLMNELEKAGYIERRPLHYFRPEGEAKARLREYLLDYMAQYPGENINLSELARTITEQLGVSPSRVRQLYYDIAKEINVPRVSRLRKSQKAWMTESLYRDTQRLYEKGLTIPEMMETLKLNRHRVEELLRTLRESAVITTRGGSYLFDQEVSDLRRAGLGNKEIARRLGIEKYTVTYILRRLSQTTDDLRIRKRHNRDELQKLDPKIISYYQRGFTYSEIATLLNIRPTTLNGIIHRLINTGRVTSRKQPKLRKK